MDWLRKHPFPFGALPRDDYRRDTKSLSLNASDFCNGGALIRATQFVIIIQPIMNVKTG